MKLLNAKCKNLNWTDLNHSTGTSLLHTMNMMNPRDTKNNFLNEADLADTRHRLSYEVRQSVSESYS
jgi:hypothetical protein